MAPYQKVRLSALLLVGAFSFLPHAMAADEPAQLPAIAEERSNLPTLLVQPPPNCPGLVSRGWSYSKNFAKEVWQSGGMRFIFKGAKPGPEVSQWRWGIFKNEKEKTNLFLNPVRFTSGKITSLFNGGEHYEFRPWLALEERVLQNATRKISERWMSKTYEMSRIFLFGLSLSVGWFGYDYYTQGADKVTQVSHQQMIQSHELDWNYLLEHDLRFVPLRKMLQSTKTVTPEDRNSLIHSQRERILEHLQFLLSSYTEMKVAGEQEKAVKLLLENYGALFYRDLEKIINTSQIQPSGIHLLLADFKPNLDLQQKQELMDIRNRTMFKYELAYGLVEQPSSFANRTYEIKNIFGGEREIEFMKKVIFALASRKISKGQALLAVHKEITWADQLSCAETQRLALRVKSQGQYTNDPLSIDIIQHEILNDLGIK